MDKQELRNRLQQKYQRTNWMETAKAVFNDVAFFDKPQSIIVTDKIVRGFYQLGFVRLSDGKSLTIFEVQIAENVNISRNKVQLRNITTKFIDQENNHGVLVIYDQGKDIYRFTFASKESRFNNKLELEVNETSAKRYTYVLGNGETCSTAADRFYQLSQKKEISLNDFVEAFSVEKLNKDFFKQYKTIYQKFCDYISSQDQYRKAFKVKEGKTKEEIEINEKPIRDFTKKLLGRIVFLHFLQRKGWMGCPAGTNDWKNGDPLFMKNMFALCPEKDKFLSKYLNELFFNTLNNNDRNNEIFPLTLTRVPYLNGGLFDDDLPHSNWIDLPDSYFSELLVFFEQYNFTIDENSPDDQEVGIDPEMLGHIFENLLEENREKGAFYTPKEIVHYMCQESILQYLKSHIPEAKADNSPEELALERLVRIGDIGSRDDKKNFIKVNAKRIEELLDTVKICDPAIGSGAFPMGILQEIFKIKMALDLTLDPAKVKKEIIQNTIYGVDIDKGAVDIARLRFWLALVVDEEIPQPLPNLDYKIMQGNSLLELYEGVDLSNLTDIETDETYFASASGQFEIGVEFSKKKQTLLVFDEKSKKELYSLINAYFDFDSKTNKKYLSKQYIKDQINSIVEGKLISKFHSQLAKVETQIVEKESQIVANKILSKDPKGIKQKKEKNIERLKKNLAAKRKELDRLTEIVEHLHELQNSNDKPYFLWHLWFKEVFDKGGFDIVIGNPPYIQLQRMGREADVLESAGYSSFARTGDIYSLFYELAFNILKKNGILTYITSNKWMRAAYGEVLRKYFIENTNPLWLIDFAGFQVFETATVDTNILIAQKSQYQNSTQTCLLGKGFNSLKNLSDYFRQNAILTSYFSASHSWAVLSDIEIGIKRKIEQLGKPLKEWDIKINYGIKTGFNNAFIIDAEMRKTFIEKSPKSAEIIRPILRGRDIKRYKVDFAELWILFIPWHFPLHSDSSITGASIEAEKAFVEQYPAMFEYLLKHKNSLLERNKAETGIRYEWYALQRYGANYWQDFSLPKITWGNLALNSQFAYTKEPYIINAPSSFFASDNLYLLAVLNSKVGQYYIKNLGVARNGGYVEFKPMFVEQVPIPEISASQQIEFTSFVNEIMNLRNSGKEEKALKLEAEVDQLILKFTIYPKVKLIYYLIVPANVSNTNNFSLSDKLNKLNIISSISFSNNSVDSFCFFLT